MLDYIVFPIATLLYKYSFNIYKFLYFLYKSFVDKDEINLVNKNIKPGDNVLDIGANIGFYIPLLSKLVGSKGKVFAFEPEKNNFSHLKHLIKKYKNTKAFPYAVGNKNGHITLYESNNINVDNKTYKTNNYKYAYKVKTIRVDSIIKNRIDLVKIDIQGSEYSALLGMKKTLVNNKRIILIVECWPTGLKANNTDIKDIYKYLISLGFLVFNLRKRKLIKIKVADLKKYDRYRGYKFENWIVSRSEITF